jgi:hypothetical protein
MEEAEDDDDKAEDNDDYDDKGVGGGCRGVERG